MSFTYSLVHSLRVLVNYLKSYSKSYFRVKSALVNKLKQGKVIRICFVLLICTGNFGANMTSSLHNLGIPCVKAVTHILKTDTFPKSRCTTHLMHKQFWHKIHDEEEIFIFALSATPTTPAHTVQLGRCKWSIGQGRRVLRRVWCC